LRVSSNTVLTEEHLKDVVKLALKSPAFSFDLEASGENRGVPHLCNVSWISIATDDLCVSIPAGHPIGSKIIGEWKEKRVQKNGVKFFSMPTYEDPLPQLSPGVAFEILHPLFFNDRQIKITHGGPGYDFPALDKYYGEPPWLPWDCTMTMGWLCNENRKQFGLKEQVKDIYGVDYDNEHVGRCVEKWPFNKVARYAYLDALYPWFMHPRFLRQIQAEGLEDAYALEQDQYLPVCMMKLAGVTVDVPRLESLRETLSVRLVAEETQVYKSAHQEFNINSTQQKQHVLYDAKPEGQGLKPWKETPGGGWSVDASVLESYPSNPVCQALLQYAGTHKLLSNYVLSWLGDEEAGRPSQIHDGRIYTSFKPYGTVTGRYSSADPNLMNIPRPDTDDGKLIRGAFIAPPGWKLVVGDYGQIELVILAHLIGYGRLYDGFWAGIDPHQITAAGILGKDPEDVTKDERQFYGKTMNFTIVNGAGDEKVASMINGSVARAKKVLAKHQREFPEIYAFKAHAISKAREREPVPYIRTLIGRKRRLPDLNSQRWGPRMYAERQLFNTLIQGGAADILKTAITRTVWMLAEAVPEAALVLNVHDELVVVTPDEYAEEVEQILIMAMTGPAIQAMLNVPLKVDTAIVDRWSAAK